MYVSPFTDMDSEYQFELSRPSEDLRLSIIMRSAGEAVLTAQFSGQRRVMTDFRLAMTFVRYPLMTLKVTAGIHYEALRLWLKRIPLVPRAAATNKISSSHSAYRESDQP